MTIVTSSKYNWQPGQQYHPHIDEVVTARGKTGVYQVRVKSELRSHASKPGGFVYEVEFLDGSGTWAIDAAIIEPSSETQQEIASGRSSLGL